jgi:hypothetical protein
MLSRFLATACLLAAPMGASAQTPDAWSWPPADMPVVSATMAGITMMETLRRLPKRERFETAEEYAQRWRSSKYDPRASATVAEPALMDLVLLDGGVKSSRCTKDYDADRARFVFECRVSNRSGLARTPGDPESADTLLVQYLEANSLQIGPAGKEKRPTVYYSALGAPSAKFPFLGTRNAWSAELPMARDQARLVDRGLRLFAVFQPEFPLAVMDVADGSITLEFEGRRQAHRIFELTLMGELRELWLVDTLNKRIVFRADPKTRAVNVNPEYQ